MHEDMSKAIRILFLFLLVFTCTCSSAGQTGGCHCFRDRFYNPADRFVSDSYLLTTVFNSLTADFFSIAKRQIIMLKMKGGVQNDDLLIALYISRSTGIEITDILAEKKNRAWQQVLAEVTVPDSFRKDKWYSRMLTGMPDTKAAEDITGEIFSSRFGVTQKEMQEMVHQGYSLREIAVILTLAEHVQTAPEIISSPYREKGLSWSEIAHNFGLEPADVGKLAGKQASKQQ